MSDEHIAFLALPIPLVVGLAAGYIGVNIGLDIGGVPYILVGMAAWFIFVYTTQQRRRRAIRRKRLKTARTRGPWA